MSALANKVESAPNNSEVNILVGEGGEIREGGLSTVEPMGRRPVAIIGAMLLTQ